MGREWKPAGRIFVRLTPEVMSELCRQAQAERRHPSNQAGVIVERWIAEYLQGKGD